MIRPKATKMARLRTIPASAAIASETRARAGNPNGPTRGRPRATLTAISPPTTAAPRNERQVTKTIVPTPARSSASLDTDPSIPNRLAATTTARVPRTTCRSRCIREG